MKHSEMTLAARDFWRRNEYGLKEFVIRDGKKHPFAVVCPGGGYSMVCSFLEGVPYANRLNEQGYSAFVLYYRCRKKARYPAPMEDLARALRDILNRAEELNLETEGYSIWGSSAGGHLAASFGTETMGYSRFGLPKPGALILCYPVITMGARTHKGSRNNLLGSDPAEALTELTSVEKQITANYPPTFVWCGDTDRTVDPENSRMLSGELEKNGIPHRFVEYPGVDHGVGLGNGLACEKWFEESVAFWESQRNKMR
ncbi:MAG: alpha/beta hydrolase [Faecousia sp.]